MTDGDTHTHTRADASPFSNTLAGAAQWGGRGRGIPGTALLSELSRWWFQDVLNIEKLWSYWPRLPFACWLAAALPEPTSQYTPFLWPQNGLKGQLVGVCNLFQIRKYLHPKFGAVGAIVRL